MSVRWIAILSGGIALLSVSSTMAISLKYPAAIDYLRAKLKIPDTRFRDGMRVMNGRLDRSTPPSFAVFLGDSITMGLPISAIASHAVNFSIAGQTSAELLEEAHNLNAIKNTRAMFLMIGINDLAQHKTDGFEDRLKHIMALAPNNAAIILSTPPPPYKWLEYQATRMNWNLL